MTVTYWAIARVGEHPSAARSEDWIGNQKLQAHDCEAFFSRAELASSMRFMEILTDEEDPALHWEIVRFTGEPSQRRSDLSYGVYVACVREDERSALIPWLQELESSGNPEERTAAERALKFYRENREAWELD